MGKRKGILFVERQTSKPNLGEVLVRFAPVHCLLPRVTWIPFYYYYIFMSNVSSEQSDYKSFLTENTAVAKNKNKQETDWVFDQETSLSRSNRNYFLLSNSFPRLWGYGARCMRVRVCACVVVKNLRIEHLSAFPFWSNGGRRKTKRTKDGRGRTTAASLVHLSDRRSENRSPWLVPTERSE